MKMILIRALGITFLVFAYACKKALPPPQTGPVPVNTQAVQSKVVAYHDVYPGNIVALYEVQLRSEVSGFITGIFFKEGQSVHKGQKLYEIERDRYAANYSQAVAGLQIAKSNLEKAKKDSDRYHVLAEKEAIAKQKLDYAETDLKNAQQQVTSAEAALSKASLDLRHSLIVAPFDGTIGISPQKLGTFITAGQSILNVISSDEPMAVDFFISEKEIPHFVKLNESKQCVSDSIFTILLPDKSLYTLPGEIDLFDRAVDPQTGTLKVRLKFPNPQHILKTGMSCDIRVLNQTGRPVILIPKKALTEQMGEFFVYVIEKDTARQKKVTVGQTVDSNSIILSGINAKDTIVTDGTQKLKEGSPVMLGAPKQNIQAPSSPK